MRIVLIGLVSLVVTSCSEITLKVNGHYETRSGDFVVITSCPATYCIGIVYSNAGYLSEFELYDLVGGKADKPRNDIVKELLY